MSKSKFVLNRAGVAELLKGAEMQAILENHASTIAGRADGEHEVFVAPTRAVAKIKGDGNDNKLLKGMR